MSVADVFEAHSPEAVAGGVSEFQCQEALLKTGALQDAIFNSAYFSSIATDEKGVIQIFNKPRASLRRHRRSGRVRHVADGCDPRSDRWYESGWLTLRPPRVTLRRWRHLQ